jgi:hypothetical protein
MPLSSIFLRMLTDTFLLTDINISIYNIEMRLAYYLTIEVKKNGKKIGKKNYGKKMKNYAFFNKI